jgi:hypothetical protein
MSDWPNEYGTPTEQDEKRAEKRAMSIQRTLETTCCPEFVEDDGTRVRLRHDGESWIRDYWLQDKWLPDERVSDSEANPHAEKHLMEWLAKRNCPDGCLADQLEAIALLIQAYADSETNLLQALQKCICAIDEAKTKTKENN